MNPKFSLLTGAGQGNASGSSQTCPANRGGTAVQSDSDAEWETGFTEPMKLTHHTRSFNVTWNLKAAMTDSAVGTTLSCPTTSHNYVYALSSGNISGYVWINSTYGSCQSTAQWAIEQITQVCVEGTQTCVNGYSNMANGTGIFDEISNGTENYSNPALGTNYSYNYTQVSVYGSTNSTAFNGAWSGYANGSWARGTKVILTNYLDFVTYTDVIGATRAHADAKIDAAGPSGHVDLIGVAVS